MVPDCQHLLGCCVDQGGEARGLSGNLGIEGVRQPTAVHISPDPANQGGKLIPQQLDLGIRIGLRLQPGLIDPGERIVSLPSGSIVALEVVVDPGIVLVELVAKLLHLGRDQGVEAQLIGFDSRKPIVLDVIGPEEQIRDGHQIQPPFVRRLLGMTELSCNSPSVFTKAQISSYRAFRSWDLATVASPFMAE